jgi:hypothetical protein
MYIWSAKSVFKRKYQSKKKVSIRTQKVVWDITHILKPILMNYANASMENTATGFYNQF